MDEMDDLATARAVARANAAVATQLAEFADDLSPVVEPEKLIEYDNLVAREAALRGTRQDAFERLGFPVPSVEGG
jgi:hypothetical protein